MNNSEALFCIPKDRKISASALSSLILLCAASLCSSVRADTNAVPSERCWSILEAADTLEVFAAGKPAGSIVHHIVVDSVNRRVRQSSRATFGNGGMQVNEYTDYDWQGDLVRAEQQMQSPAGKNRWLLEKKQRDDWLLTIIAGGVSSSRKISHVTTNLDVTYQILKQVYQNNITAGQIWHDTLFSLTSGKNVPIRTECRQVPDEDDSTWIFVNRDEVTKTDEVWEIDRQGRIIRQEIPPMFTARRKHAGDTDHDRQEIAIDQLSELFHIPARPHTSGEQIIVSGDSTFELHGSVRQFYTPVAQGFRLHTMPDSCGGEERKPDPRYLQPTPTMQVDAAVIVKLADSLGQGASGRCETIKRAWEFVYNTIEKRNVATFSSALETLSAGYGDCGEHAVTLAAILRAAGIPARVVLGLVHIEHKKGYFYHAWVMVPNGSRWLFVDPALGRFPAAKGYIPMVIDDTGADAAYLAGHIGKIGVLYTAASTDSIQE